MSYLKPVHYKKFEKFLLYIGCYFVRQKGSHRIYKREGLIRPIVIPANKDIPIFIIRNNLRILSISVKEYMKLLLKI